MSLYTPPPPGENYKVVDFPNQYEYDEWLKKHQRFKPGDLACFKGLPDIKQDNWPAVSVCVAIQDDLPSLTWSKYGQARGYPCVYHIRTITSAAPNGFTGPPRWDEAEHLRPLREDEVDYVMSHAILSNRLKEVLKDIPGAGQAPA